MIQPRQNPNFSCYTSPRYDVITGHEIAPMTGLNTTQLNTFSEKHSKLVLRMTRELLGTYGLAKVVR